MPGCPTNFDLPLALLTSLCPTPHSETNVGLKSWYIPVFIFYCYLASLTAAARAATQVTIRHFNIAKD